jgi:hypothetical protein
MAGARVHRAEGALFAQGGRERATRVPVLVRARRAGRPGAGPGCAPAHRPAPAYRLTVSADVDAQDEGRRPVAEAHRDDVHRLPLAWR